MLFILEFDSTIGDEVDLPFPTAESKEELDEEADAERREEERRESGAETSESEQVVVSPRQSRLKAVSNVRSLVFIFKPVLHVAFPGSARALQVFERPSNENCSRCWKVLEICCLLYPTQLLRCQRRK